MPFSAIEIYIIVLSWPKPKKVHLRDRFMHIKLSDLSKSNVSSKVSFTQYQTFIYVTLLSIIISACEVAGYRWSHQIACETKRLTNCTVLPYILVSVRERKKYITIWKKKINWEPITRRRPSAPLLSKLLAPNACWQSANRKQLRFTREV